jgi:hypothetical protein
LRGLFSGHGRQSVRTLAGARPSIVHDVVIGFLESIGTLTVYGVWLTTPICLPSRERMQVAPAGAVVTSICWCVAACWLDSGSRAAQAPSTARPRRVGPMPLLHLSVVPPPGSVVPAAPLPSDNATII